MEALLSPTEIDIVWQYATPIDGKDQNYIRQDFLGAEIHKNDYEKDSLYGWCAEYVLSPQDLQQMGIANTNILCEANVRVLQLGNFTSNIGHRRGHYERHITLDKDENRHQTSWQVSDISEYGISELRKAFSLKDEQIQSLFP